MKQELYPLTFHPIYKEKLWGGRQLERILGRTLPPGPIGESWDVAAHAHGTSVVDRGPLAGKNLQQLVDEYGEKLLGERFSGSGSFPLLLKLIDANDDLSVQVHPDDAAVRRHGGEAFGKTEMWYIVHSEPGAWIIWGLKPGVTKEKFAQAVDGGREAILECLNKVFVRPGEVYPISAGLVHALGAGCLVAEIQQNSDTTYRVYDWDRVDAQGKPRELHVQQALDVIDFSPQAQDKAYHLARCAQYFQFEVLDKPQGLVLDSKEGFQILTALGGSTQIAFQGGAVELAAGQSCLLPAALGSCTLHAAGTILRSSPPRP